MYWYHIWRNNHKKYYNRYNGDEDTNKFFYFTNHDICIYLQLLIDCYFINNVSKHQNPFRCYFILCEYATVKSIYSLSIAMYIIDVNIKSIMIYINVNYIDLYILK